MAFEVPTRPSGRPVYGTERQIICMRRDVLRPCRMLHGVREHEPVVSGQAHDTKYDTHG